MNNKKLTFFFLMGAISLSSISIIHNNFNEHKNTILQVSSKNDNNSPLARYLSELVFMNPNDFNQITQREFDQIKTLNISDVYMNLNNENSSILNKLKNLKTINIINSTIIGKIPQSESIQNLNLVNSNFSQNSFYNINSSSNLQSIKIENSSLSSGLPSSMNNLKKLKDIKILNSSLNSNLLESLSFLNQLQNITIINSNFQGGLPTTLDNLTSLNTLKIINTHLTGTIPTSIGKLNNLKTLNLLNTGINGTIPASIGNLNRLTTLELSGGNLIGYIPKSLNNLSNLRILELNNNQLIGNFISKNKELKMNLENNLLASPEKNQAFLKANMNIANLNNLTKNVYLEDTNSFNNVLRSLSKNYILKVNELAPNKNEIEIIGYKNTDGTTIYLTPNSIYKNLITNPFNYKNNYNKKLNKKNNKEAPFTSSILESLYELNNGDIVLNGNLNSNITLSNKIKKEVLIKNSNNTIVAAFNSVPVNWYSKDNNTYSGFQSILSKHILSLLKHNKNYNIFVRVYINNKYYDIPISNLKNLNFHNNQFIFGSSKNNDLTFSNDINSNITKTSAITKDLYFSNNDYVINGNVNNFNISKNINKEIILKNSDGKVITTINTVPVDWYSKTDNFSGFQGIIPSLILNNLNKNCIYNIFLKFNLEGKTYEIPLKIGESKLVNNTTLNTLNNSGNLSILVPTYKKSTDGSAIVENNGTGWIPYGYVINAKIHIKFPLNKNSKINIISENPTTNAINTTIAATPVNWYSQDKNDYSGFQVIINPKEITKLTGSNNKLFAQIISNNVIYTIPLKGTLNSSSHFSFSINNLNKQIVINKI